LPTITAIYRAICSPCTIGSIYKGGATSYSDHWLTTADDHPIAIKQRSQSGGGQAFFIQ